jgi:hypothetical protein
MCKKEFKAKTTVARTENHQSHYAERSMKLLAAAFFVVGMPPKLICAEQ